MSSETSAVREVLARYCAGDGLDIGYGGDPIVPAAICFDLPARYGKVGDSPQHLHGDCRALPFQSNTLDYVYSSHLLEDFTYDSQVAVLGEWARVVRHKGLIIICCPDQQRFKAHCQATGQCLNSIHKEPDFSMQKFLEKVLPRVAVLTVIASRDNVGPYSWWCMLQKG